MDKFKTTMRNILYSIILTSFVFISCQDNKTQKSFINGKQVPIFNSQKSHINIISLDSVFVDQEFYACIVQTSASLNLKEVYIGSHPDNYNFKNSLVDTNLKQLDNCSIKLKTIGDTAYFGVTPTKSKNYLYKVAVLSVDEKLNYYLDTLDMSFYASEKTKL
jgi:hypothetical protein